MIPCFQPKCKSILASLDQLLNHYKTAHHMTSLDPVRCNFCPRNFTNLRAFKKHFVFTHKQYVFEDPTASSSGQVITTEDPLSECCINTNTVSPSLPSTSNVIPVSEAAVNDEFNITQTDDNIQEALKEKVLSFCSEMYSHPGIPSSHAEMTFNIVLNLVKGIDTAYKHKLMNSCINSNNPNSGSIVSNMNSIFNFVEDTFSSYSTNYRALKILQEEGYFVPPKLKTLGYTSKRRKFKRRFCVVRTKETMAFIPIRHVFRKFLEQKDVLPNILQYLEKLKLDDVIIENVVQGECWRKFISHKENENKIILPVFLDNDDIEIGSCLSGHAGIQKINATYCSIPCLMPENRASLDHIFLVALTKSSNLKRFGNRKIFWRIIKELKYLSDTGILVSVDGKTVRVFFQLCSLIGDNLGLNTIAGFVKNFSTSNFCCRTCLANKIQRNYYTLEDPNLLRTIENYLRDVCKENFKKTGIHELCIFNVLRRFHIITNGGVDVTHDLFEGVVSYDLCLILKHFIFTSKNFTLSMANDRISKFNYGSADTSSKPPPLPENLMKRRTLKMSASETACLLKYFGLLFVNLGNPIPADDPVWQLYVALRKVVDIVMSPFIDLKVCDLLTTYIAEHHRLYIILTKKVLPFKFHSMTHYPSLMRKFGPLVHLSTIRFEHKHRTIKSVSNAVASRRNISFTMARKCQLELAHKFFSKKFSDKKLHTGPTKAFNNNERFWEEIADFIFTTPIPEILRNKFTVRTPWVECKGTKYCEGDTLYVESDEDTNLPMFGFIKNIFVSNGVVYFLLRNFRTLSFNEHLYCYEMEFANSYSVVCQELLHDYRPHNAVSVLEANFYVSLLSDM